MMRILFWYISLILLFMIILFLMSNLGFYFKHWTILGYFKSIIKRKIEANGRFLDKKWMKKH